MTRKLFTIGYTGSTLEDFLGSLVEAGVELLIDTRELPISRKKGFAKTALEAHLKSIGIGYQHFKLLGSPRLDRHEVRETGDYAKFFRSVRRHLMKDDAQVAIQDALEIARKKVSCLMCCCEDWTKCHRSCVVESMTARMHFSVHHLHNSVADVTPKKAA